MNEPIQNPLHHKNDALDLLVPTTKTAAMRYLAESAGYGYCLFQQGEVGAEKALSLLTKFEQRYRVLASRGMRDHARSRGMSCARLVMFPKDDGAVWLFWLLASPGTGDLPSEASTQDARSPATRLRWLDQYELVARPVQRRTPKGQPGLPTAGGRLHHVWTWVMSAACFEGWSGRLETAAGRARSSEAHRSDYLVQQIELLRKVPGFHGINRQKRSLVLAANIPRELHEQLQLRNLGTVVNKSLPVFDATRSLRSAIVARVSTADARTCVPDCAVLPAAPRVGAEQIRAGASH